MFRKPSSSNRVASFRPTLEVLEDRIVPSQISDVFSNINSLLLGPISQAEKLALQVNVDVFLFNQIPSPGNGFSLIVDSIKLEKAANVVAQGAAKLSEAVDNVEFANNIMKHPFLTQDDINLLNGLVSTANAEATRLQNAAVAASQDEFAAFFALVTHSSATLSPLSLTQIDSFTVPSSAPHGGSVTASAVISGGLDTNVTLSVKGSDGFLDSSTKRSIFGTGVIALTVPGGAPGVVDTWTVSIDGGPSQTLTTTYTG